MREILFRGKSNYEGRDTQWFYGGLLPESQNTFPIIVRDYDNDEEWIGIFDWATVDPETVGQYTGLTDKNGKKIFEGDIVVISNQQDYPTLVKFCESGWQCVIPNDNAFTHYRHRLEDNFTKYEIIGNIHDNPELMKGGDQNAR